MHPGALKKVRDGLLSLTYPQECRVCSGAVESFDDGVACAGCWLDPTITQILSSNLCAKCGAQLPCRGCAELPFWAARSCGIYSGALEASILFLKSQPHACRRLQRIICRTFLENQSLFGSDLVVPVPLHRQRERERGFNQAAIIARIISRQFDLPLDARSLSRVKYTERHRAGLDSVDRARSVERAFKVERARVFEGASVLLVDDLLTTGSTICEATGALIEAGANRVSVLTIARVADAMSRRADL